MAEQACAIGTGGGLTSVINWRDFGGIETADGGRVVSNRLFRCGQMAEIDDADLERLAALDIAMVVDLRTQIERNAKPSRRPAAFRGILVESPAVDHGPAPHLAIAQTRLQPDEAQNYMSGHYAGFVRQAWLRDTLTRFFARLAEAEGGVIVHCTAGKDRTGITVALVLALLGVSQDAIFEDYLKSNADLARLCQSEGARILRGRFGAALSDEVMGLFMGVQRGYLAAALATIVADHGSIDAYMREALGVSREQADRIRAKFVTPRPLA